MREYSEEEGEDFSKALLLIHEVSRDVGLECLTLSLYAYISLRVLRSCHLAKALGMLQLTVYYEQQRPLIPNFFFDLESHRRGADLL